MLQRLKGAQLLQGFRGSNSIDLDRLADILGRIGELASDQRDSIAEIDVNPLICHQQRIVAVDALIAKSQKHGMQEPMS